MLSVGEQKIILLLSELRRFARNLKTTYLTRMLLVIFLIVCFFASIYILIICCCDTSPSRYSKCIYIQMKIFFFWKIWKACFIYVQIVKTWQGNMLLDRVLRVFLTRKKHIKCISVEINEESFQSNIIYHYKCGYRRLNSLQNCNKVFTFYRKVF